MLHMNPRAPLAALAILALLVVACSPAGAGSPAASASAMSSHDATASEGEMMSEEPMASEGEMMSEEPMASAEPSSAALNSDPLHAIVLTDVRTGTQVTIGELAASGPVLLETMAIWCSNCRAQQHNVVDAHDLASFHSISLDVDPGEQPADLAAYADREGFDWTFAMADAQLVTALRDRFGTAVAVPPSMPKVLFRTDGSIELIGLGELLSPEQVATAVGS